MTTLRAQGLLHRVPPPSTNESSMLWHKLQIPALKMIPHSTRATPNTLEYHAWCGHHHIFVTRTTRLPTRLAFLGLKLGRDLASGSVVLEVEVELDLYVGFGLGGALAGEGIACNSFATYVWGGDVGAAYGHGGLQHITPFCAGHGDGTTIYGVWFNVHPTSHTGTDQKQGGPQPHCLSPTTPSPSSSPHTPTTSTT